MKDTIEIMQHELDAILNEGFALFTGASQGHHGDHPVTFAQRHATYQSWYTKVLRRAMIITLLCAVLLSMSPALAGAIGTSTTVQPVSQTTVIEVPRDGEGREGRETQGMSIPLFIIGALIGGLLGLLGYRVLRAADSSREAA